MPTNLLLHDLQNQSGKKHGGHKGTSTALDATTDQVEHSGNQNAARHLFLDAVLSVGGGDLPRGKAGDELSTPSLSSMLIPLSTSNLRQQRRLQN